MKTQYNDPKGAVGATKTPLGLIPPHAMEQTAWVHKLGADKYGPWNWRETGVCASTYVNAILRHLNAWRDGEDLDPESGISHLAHVACSANILMDAGYCGKLQDDRNTTRQCNEATKPAHRSILEIANERNWKSLPDHIRRLQKHVRSDTSYEDDWGSLDEEEYRVLDKGEILQDGDEVYVGFGDWMTLYIPHWIKQEVNDGTYRRKLITNCDLKDEVANCDLKEECECGRRYIYHWLYGWICEDCDIKYPDPYNS